MINEFSEIYSKTSHNQIQTWRIELSGDSYRTIEGLKNGTLTTSAWTLAVPKNVGKKNGTNAYDQALKEAKAKHKAKLDEGYHEKIEDIDNDKFFIPMTAKKWKDRWKKVVFPVYSQPKLDGMRCVVKIDGMWSRYGKPILSAPHIFEQLKEHLDKNTVWDGELYAHKFKKDFEKIISLARQSKPTEEDIQNSAKHLEYWVYDYCLLNHQDKVTFDERTKILENMGKKNKFGPKIKVVKTTLCNDIQELDKCYEEYLDDGMEGQMIRVINSLYENKRSNNLLKRKEFVDEEFEIIDFLSGKGGHENLASKVVLRMKDGRTFEAGLIGSHEYCEYLLKNKKKFIGQMATIVYQNKTKDGIPRFGKMKIIRNYE